MYKREPVLTKARMAQTVVVALLVGLIFLQLGDTQARHYTTAGETKYRGGAAKASENLQFGVLLTSYPGVFFYVRAIALFSHVVLLFRVCMCVLLFAVTAVAVDVDVAVGGIVGGPRK